MRNKESANILTVGPYINPKPLYKILGNCSRSFKIFYVIYTAVDIKLFDNLDTPKTLNELCKNLGIDPELTHAICKILTKLGLLKEEKGVYKNTEISNLYLRTNSPFSQHYVLKNLVDGFKLWEKLANLLKSGPVMVSEEKFFENHIHSIASEILCGELQKVVKIISKLPEFKKAKKLLDLGGGHGLYAIAFTKLNPNLEAYVFDFPEILKHTKMYIKKFNAKKVKTIPGNFFKDDIGYNYDVIFFSANPGGKNPQLIPKIYSSLNKGGLFINNHTFYRKGENSKNPLLDIEWSLTAWTGVKKRKRVYSFEGDLTLEDYIKLLKKYFSIIKIVDTSSFAKYPLSKVGDTLGSKIIIAKK